MRLPLAPGFLFNRSASKSGSERIVAKQDLTQKGETSGMAVNQPDPENLAFGRRLPNWLPDRWRKVQSGMLTSAGDSGGIGVDFAAALIESETTQAAPTIAMEIALPAQMK